MPGRMYAVRGLVARHRDYVLIDWEPSRLREHPKSWVPLENLSAAPGSNALTRNQEFFELLPEIPADEASQYPGLGI